MNRRIFISREGASRRQIINQGELWQMLSTRGFELRILEKLTPNDQIELFYDAEAVVAAHGAGLANLVHSPHAAVLELFPCDFIVPNFLFLCASLNLSYSSWRGDPQHGEDFLGLARWKRRASNLYQRLSTNGRDLNANIRAYDRNFHVDVLAIADMLDDAGIR